MTHFLDFKISDKREDNINGVEMRRHWRGVASLPELVPSAQFCASFACALSALSAVPAVKKLNITYNAVYSVLDK